jgi:hypothetical protein
MLTYAGNFGILQLATDRFKAFCSIRGSIFGSLSRGGIAADSSSKTIELEIKLILIVCTPLYMTGKGKALG